MKLPARGDLTAMQEVVKRYRAVGHPKRPEAGPGFYMNREILVSGPSEVSEFRYCLVMGKIAGYANAIRHHEVHS